MSKITFEVTVDDPSRADKKLLSDEEEEENIEQCILDSLGFPQSVLVTAKVIKREKTDAH